MVWMLVSLQLPFVAINRTVFRPGVLYTIPGGVVKALVDGVALVPFTSKLHW